MFNVYLSYDGLLKTKYTTTIILEIPRTAGSTMSARPGTEDAVISSSPQGNLHSRRRIDS
jgi:hypothetical protein